MKSLLLILLLMPLSQTYGQEKKAPTLRAILLEQLQTTHNRKDWFVPVNVALEGLTPQQAQWTDGHGNHSIGQLANHLLFWDTQQLAKFRGDKPVPFNGNNDETFNSFDSSNWNPTVKKLDEVLTAWEKAVTDASDEKLAGWSSAVAHIGAHNAYHTGQIIYIRKLQGSWDPEKGVK